MKVSVISTRELDPPLIERWREIQTSDITLRSPYYSPGFTLLVAGTGQPVSVAVIESNGRVTGFFPHQAGRFGRLMAVGGDLNDYHGLIAAPNLDLTASALLKACKGIYLGFNHLPLSHGECVSGSGVVGRVGCVCATPLLDTTHPVTWHFVNLACVLEAN
jgi:hypothetical protein